MAAILKPDGAVPPLHDATRSVLANHEIRYQGKIVCPGPCRDRRNCERNFTDRQGPFCISADIKAAHRLVKIGAIGGTCVAAPHQPATHIALWANHTGTFGVSSAPDWLAKVAGLVGRGVFGGADKFKMLWVWILSFEMVGTPFGYRKFKGGHASFVGFHIRYDLSEDIISTTRGDWLIAWVQKVASNKFVVSRRRWFYLHLGRAHVKRAAYLKITVILSGLRLQLSCWLLFVALRVFGWLGRANRRSTLYLALAGETDNRANVSLTVKRAIAKWPLMAINMQLSAALSHARLCLRLCWRPRDENQDADDLTNEVFTAFDSSKRIVAFLDDLDMSILAALVETRRGFNVIRRERMQRFRMPVPGCFREEGSGAGFKLVPGGSGARSGLDLGSLGMFCAGFGVRSDVVPGWFREISGSSRAGFGSFGTVAVASTLSNQVCCWGYRLNLSFNPDELQMLLWNAPAQVPEGSGALFRPVSGEVSGAQVLEGSDIVCSFGVVAMKFRCSFEVRFPGVGAIRRSGSRKFQASFKKIREVMSQKIPVRFL
eukprot:s4766_g3.t1